MRKFILIVLTLLSIVCVRAQEQMSFSDSAVVSLLTCSPGKEAYSAFGHTAIRVNDKVNHIDLVFNYGIFSFETENFYYKFIKGETDYILGITETSRFISEYQMRNSHVWEQILNLNASERAKLINSLVENYQPENRTYRYNFVYDNCSTRPRNKIFDAINGYVHSQPELSKKTFRQWVGVYTGSDTWLKFGIDLVFGLDADKTATQNESMFLPEIFMNDAHSAYIVTTDGHQHKLIAKSSVLVEAKEEAPIIEKWYSKPTSVFILFLIIGFIITAWDYKHRRHNKVFDTIIMFASGVAGLIIFYLMFFSVHPLVKNNLNILWLNPFNLAIAVIIWIKPMRKYRLYYQMMNASLLAISLLIFTFSIQDINIACFPLIVLLFMRSLAWLAYVKRKTKKRRDVYLRRFN